MEEVRDEMIYFHSIQSKEGHCKKVVLKMNWWNLCYGVFQKNVRISPKIVTDYWLIYYILSILNHKIHYFIWINLEWISFNKQIAFFYKLFGLTLDCYLL